VSLVTAPFASNDRAPDDSDRSPDPAPIHDPEPDPPNRSISPDRAPIHDPEPDPPHRFISPNRAPLRDPEPDPPHRFISPIQEAWDEADSFSTDDDDDELNPLNGVVATPGERSYDITAVAPPSECKYDVPTATSNAGVSETQRIHDGGPILRRQSSTESEPGPETDHAVIIEIDEPLWTVSEHVERNGGGDGHEFEATRPSIGETEKLPASSPTFRKEGRKSSSRCDRFEAAGPSIEAMGPSIGYSVAGNFRGQTSDPVDKPVLVGPSADGTERDSSCGYTSEAMRPSIEAMGPSVGYNVADNLRGQTSDTVDKPVAIVTERSEKENLQGERNGSCGHTSEATRPSIGLAVAECMDSEEATSVGSSTVSEASASSSSGSRDRVEQQVPADDDVPETPASGDWVGTFFTPSIDELDTFAAAAVPRPSWASGAGLLTDETFRRPVPPGIRVDDATAGNATASSTSAAVLNNGRSSDSSAVGWTPTSATRFTAAAGTSPRRRRENSAAASSTTSETSSWRKNPLARLVRPRKHTVRPAQ